MAWQMTNNPALSERSAQYKYHSHYYEPKIKEEAVHARFYCRFHNAVN
jgi:hypothetical protein